jgi:uncharacterized protein YkwD
MDHVNDIGTKGKTGHTGSDGTSPFDRIKKRGIAQGFQAENISYGQSQAE